MGKTMNQSATIKTERDLPFVTLSFAMSLDGKIATRTGESRHISGPQSMAFVHRLRDRHDGILVGINTVLADHPRLTTRLPDGKGRDATRIILDSQLRIPLDEPVLHLASPAPTVVICRTDADPERKAALERLGVVVIGIPDPHAPEGLREAMVRLKAMGIRSILVEGGGTVHSSFIEQRLFDRVFVTIAPIVIGGETAKPAVGGRGFATIADAARLRFVRRIRAGADLILEAVPEHSVESKPEGA